MTVLFLYFKMCSQARLNTVLCSFSAVSRRARTARCVRDGVCEEAAHLCHSQRAQAGGGAAEHAGQFDFP
jgi:hypothetical protein